MKQVCYSCGREMERCECEQHRKRPGHRASVEDGMMFVQSHPQEMLDFMLSRNCLADLLAAAQKYDPYEFQTLACCAAEVYADNYGMERIG